MTALSAPRNAPRRANRLINVTVAAATTVYAGGMVSQLANGNGAVPAGTASSGRAIGVATRTAGAGETVDLERATFRFSNSADADLIAAKDIGEVCYVVDDQTVALTSDEGARPVAGAIVDVDSVGVWVEVGPGAVGPQGPQGEQGVPG